MTLLLFFIEKFFVFTFILAILYLLKEGWRFIRGLNTGEYEIPVNFIVRDGQIMRYYNNYVFNEFGHHWDCYFGIDCYSVNDTIVKIDKNSEIIFDFLVLNTKTGELFAAKLVSKK